MAGTAEWFLRIEVGRVGGNVLLSSCTVGPDPHEYARPTCGVHNETDMVCSTHSLCPYMHTSSHSDIHTYGFTAQ